MIVWAELSGENPDLARAEVIGAAEAMGGIWAGDAPFPAPAGYLAVDLPDVARVRALADRLALTRRLSIPWEVTGEEHLRARLRREGASRRSVAIRWSRHAAGSHDLGMLRGFGTAYREGGGTVDLRHPARRFWLHRTATDQLRLSEEIAVVDRTAFAARRLPRFPFQRPVTLPRRLARAAVNLARVRTGDRVVDPFVGTGTLLLEAALVGALAVGIDREAVMIRGTLRNFESVGRHPQQLLQADAEVAATHFPPASFDALVTDPPYGRASPTGGEPPEALVRRVIRAWSDRVRAGGRLVVIVPAELGPLPVRGALEYSGQHRVHRSLVREFRVYVASGIRGASDPVRT